MRGRAEENKKRGGRGREREDGEEEGEAKMEQNYMARRDWRVMKGLTAGLVGIVMDLPNIGTLPISIITRLYVFIQSYWSWKLLQYLVPKVGFRTELT